MRKWGWILLVLAAAGVFFARQAAMTGNDGGFVAGIPEGAPALEGSSIKIADQEIRMTPFLWKNLMPTRGPEDRSRMLLMSFELSASPGPLPSGISAERAWLMYEGRVWEAALQPSIAPGKPGTRFWNPAGHPEAPSPEAWEPGARVDVIVRLRTEAGSAFFLRANGALIETAH
jgi:hypothetical protein